MRIISTITFTLLLVSQCVLAQSETLNQVDINGLKQGKWIKYYENGNMRYSATFKDNKPIGEVKRYDEEGNLKAILSYSEDNAEVPAQLFYANGDLFAEGTYITGKKDGLWKYYSYYDKKLKASEEYTNDVLHGKVCTYYPNGQITEEVTYVNGMKNGKWIQYYESGKVKQEAAYQDDVVIGDFVIYYNTGYKYLTGKYNQGKMDSTWYYLDDKGQIVNTAIYNNGTLLNAEEMEEDEREFFKSIDHSKGKYNEPTIEDVLPM